MKKFFALETQMRSLAHGRAVSKEFSEWQEYFSKGVNVYREKFRPFSQKHFYGNIANVGKELPENTRSVNGEKYELSPDGFVTIGGTKSNLRIGQEIKGWSLISFPRREGQVLAMAVIGKPVGTSQMQLCIYRSVGRNWEGEPSIRIPLDSTLDAESYLACFGRHLFLVHNFKFNYYYYDYEANELQEVAIGTDTENKDKECCDMVAHIVVANDDGWVFWHTQETVDTVTKLYGFPIGYPTHLRELDCPITERILNIQGEGKSLVVTRQDKNTARIVSYRYERTEENKFSVTEKVEG